MTARRILARLGLLHSPSLSLLGRCRCHRRGCRATRTWGTIADAFDEGWRRGIDDPTNSPPSNFRDRADIERQ